MFVQIVVNKTIFADSLSLGDILEKEVTAEPSSRHPASAVYSHLWHETCPDRPHPHPVCPGPGVPPVEAAVGLHACYRRRGGACRLGIPQHGGAGRRSAAASRRTSGYLATLCRQLSMARSIHGYFWHVEPWIVDLLHLPVVY